MGPHDDASQPSPGSIFISYRRDDSADVAGRVYDWLVREFPGERVFKDVDSIPFGVDFRDHMRTALEGCRVVLVIMGKEWLDIRGKSGTRRLDDSGDYVRLEVETALHRRPAVTVIPVLVGGGTMPAADALPESLRDLRFLHSPQLRRDPDFSTDMGRLIARIKALMAAPRPEPEPPPAVGRAASETPAAQRTAGIASPTSPTPGARRAVGIVILPILLGFGIWGLLRKPGPSAVDGEPAAGTGVPAPGPATDPTPALLSGSLEGGAIGKTITCNLALNVPIKFCYCPAGSFTMGSPETEAERSDNEKQVAVTLSKGFWLAQTEFTQAQWRAVMGDDPSEFKGDDLPVESVSWNEAQRCMTVLNTTARLPGNWQWALPTEAQWEYACRAGTTTVFSFGDTLTSAQANFDGNHPYGTTEKGLLVPFFGKTAAVASYQPNAWGLYDMHGNVFEWCADLWDGSTAHRGSTDPHGKDGGLRMLRGGTWINAGMHLRSAYRHKDQSTLRGSNKDWGFRPAIVPPVN